MHLSKLCSIGRKEFDDWFNEYAESTKRQTDEWQKILFRPFKHIPNCDICQAAYTYPYPKPKSKRAVGKASKRPHKP